MDSIIKDSFFEKCTACGACANACPTDSIQLREGKDGFLYPIINNRTCIDCKKCVSVCPVNGYINNNIEDAKIFASRASDEIRYRSSSGGMFTILAKNIINRNGVVYCVEMDEKQKVKHIRIEKEEDIIKGCGSKYVQSEVGLAYRSVENDLKNGKLVLFTGCPCQVAGLNNFLGKEYSTLFTVDVVCHGVPSQYMFDKYLEEKRNGNIIDVRFRTKAYGWRADVISIYYKDFPLYAFSAMQGDSYEKGFQYNLILRDSCEYCNFCTFPRVADLSIGDFWGLEKYIANDNKGTSIVFINNRKGEELFRGLVEDLQMCEEMDINKKEIRNRVFAYYPHNANKKLFFEHIKTKTFSESIDYALNGVYEVGIVGIPTVENFGGALTYFALYKVVSSFDLPCVLIERPQDAPHPPVSIGVDYYKSPYGNNLVSNLRTKQDYIKLNKTIRKFLVGSDQLFHHNLYNNFGKICTLDWVDDNKRKIAYAASFGHEKFTGDDNERAEISYYLKKFDAFSVREKSGVELAKNDFGIDAEHVLDPIFLCDKVEYEKLAKNARNQYDYPHVAAYILDPNKEKEAFLDAIEGKIQLKTTVFSEMFYNNQSIKSKWGRDIEVGKIEDRIANIIHSDFVVTDSFHGMCMAIVFRKNFIVINNPGRGSARFESLLQLLNLKDRLVLATANIKDNYFGEIDYDRVDAILNAEKQRCLKWLKYNLFCEAKKPFSNYDMMNRKLFESNRELKARIDAISKHLMIDFVGETKLTSFLDKLLNSYSKLRDITILIAAKDTPGMAFTDEIAEKLQAFGLKADFKDLHWFGYAAILKDNTVLDEKFNYDRTVQINRVINNLDITINSSPLHDGNNANIIINGINYAQNSRGLNFVIVDSNSGSVLDAVAFDTHSKFYNCKRTKYDYFD